MGHPPAPTVSYNTSNQVASGLIGYDASGNVTSDSGTGNTYLYDGEGRLCAVRSEPVGGTYTMIGYIYDADGARVAKGSITSMSCNLNTNGFRTINDYILGPSGEQMTEMGVDANNSVVWQHTNAWAGGTLLATYDAVGLHFYLNDPLGTRRVQTDYAGVLEQTCSSLPFGDGESCAPTPTEHLFTGKERDAESGNDYFGARYYSSAMGRWMSPDWSAKMEPVPYAKLDNPQSLNLYSYVLNNPLSNVDPDGHAGSCGAAAGDGSSCKVTMTQIKQTVNFYDKSGNVVSSVNVTTNMSTVSNSITGAVVSANASATATNGSGLAFNSSQLATIGSTVGSIQQAGASMALGSNPTQLMTAIVAKESTLGLAAPTNPLQLSGSSGYKPRAGDTGYNVQTALNVLQERGRRSGYDPASTYGRYNGVGGAQGVKNVNDFMNIYNGMSQSSWGFSPSMPAAPVPAGLQ